MGGILFGGIAIGPSIGSLLIKWSGDILFPFYVAMTLHLIYLLVAIFLIPESLSLERQLAARQRHRDDIAARAAKDLDERNEAYAAGPVWLVLTHVKRAMLMPWAFLRPLSLLLPSKGPPGAEDTPVLRSRGPPRQGWDAELMKISIGYALYVMVVVSFVCS